MTRVRILGFLVCLVGATALTIGSTPSPATFTVGDFSVMIASRIQVEDTGAQMTEDQALEILERAGVKVEGELSSPLTEKDAAKIFGQLGIKIQAGSPDDLLDQARANALLSIFGDTLSATSSKATGLTVVKTDGSARAALSGPRPEVNPEDCQQLPHDCRDQVGGDCITCKKCCSDNFPTTRNFCAKLCQKKNLTSPTDPTP